MTYHLEDGSVDIWEPRSENSGLEQGRILHRMRVPNQHGAGGVMTPGDFNVGCSPIIFKREYHVLACDAFTRAFLEREGYFEVSISHLPTFRLPDCPYETDTFFFLVSRIWRSPNAPANCACDGVS